MNSTTLLLIRHGATPANEQQPRILQGGAIDQSLSERGRQQAADVAGFLADRPINAIYSSRLKRAVETAQQIAEYHDIEAQAIDGIQEVNVGQWERLDWDTIRERYPVEYDHYMEDSAVHGYLGGENYTQVQARITPVFQELAAQHIGQTIAVVAHTVVNRTFLATLLGIELRRGKDLPQENCCINVVSCDGNKMKLVTLNSALHMRQ
jgi:broad specificity phosphatase PhoE